MKKYSKKWWIKWCCAAGIRALKTFAQTMITLIGSDYISIVDLNWASILGISTTTAFLSILTSITTGLPEVKER
jgi:hypothetical protein